MDDLEKTLSERRLVAPSAELDRRMEVAFTQVDQAARATHLVRRWWWLVLFPIGAACLFLLIALHPVSSPPASPVVFEFEPKGLMREMLITPPARLRAPPVVIVGLEP